MKPILCITSPNADDMSGGDLEQWALEGGFTLLLLRGKTESAKILSPKRMKRSDYAACINAAKAILKKDR